MNWQTRQHCATLTPADCGKTSTFYGWIDTIRDHGHLLFIHLRDITGIVQIVFHPENKEAYALAQTLRSEYVIELTGKVANRHKDTYNPHLATGTLEILAQTLTILSEAETPPFLVSEKDAFGNEDHHTTLDEDLRLTYRYLDLRRPSIQQKLIQRSKIIKTIRDTLHAHCFMEIETPMLTKSTPEGARDYLVPSRVHAGKFYALPQSPQLFKQLLMMSGFERYFQIVKCFRDEDLRPNRQPEFTQMDLEASFIDEAFIQTLIETLMTQLYADQGQTLQAPFQRMTYSEAINTYGSDKPDLRFGLKMVEVTSLFKNTSYKIFNTIVNSGGMIKGINIKGQAQSLSKNVLQEELAKGLIPKLGGKGMTWMKVENGILDSNIVQFFSEEEKTHILTTMQAEEGDVLIFIADTKAQVVHDVLGKFRLHIAQRQNMIPDTLAACWIIDFPLFEYQDGRLYSVHHPFTQPHQPLTGKEDSETLLNMKARAYDLVVNGEEIGGGSIRIHRWEQQKIIFELLGLSEAEINEKFGFFVKALTYGAPPHGGIALGIDRLVSMLLKTDSIRDVIAFPKNRMAYCPLTHAPDTVKEEQLREVHIKPLGMTL